jgi:hypothetical protein
MRLRFLVVSLVVLVLSAGTGYAQTFTGTVDGYWNYNSNTPKNPNQSTFRAFDIRNESFALNYGELAIDYKPSNVGVRVDIGFGDTANVVTDAGPNGWSRHIQQAYITATKDKFTFDFGKFVTPIGAEVIETKDNWNYTRGLLFTLAIPFTHFGGRATVVASDKVTLAGYLVNGWDNAIDENSAKSIGVMGSFKPHEKVGVVANFLTGKETPVGPTPPFGYSDYMRKLLDVIVTFNVNDRLSLMVNGDYGQDKGPNLLPGVSGSRVVWQGIAGYAKIKASDKVTLVGRYEWFDDQDGFRTNEIQEVQSGTFTLQIPVSDLMIWGEVRQDWSNKSPFRKTTDGVFAPVDSFTDHQNTFTVGMTYSFTKEVKQ